MRLVLIGGFQHALGSFLGGLGSSLGLTLAATHFTWVVRGAAVWQHYGGGRRLFHRGWLDNYRCGFDDCRRRFCSHFWLGIGGRRWLLGNGGLLDHDLGLLGFTGLDNRCFGNRCFNGGCIFSGRCFDRCFGNDHWLSSGRGFLNHRLWCDFDHWLDAGFDHGDGAADGLLDHWGDDSFLGLGNPFSLLGRLGDFAVFSGHSFGAGALGLLVGFSLCSGADVAAGDSGGDGQAGSQIGAKRSGLVLLRLFFTAFFFAAFDQLAIA